MQASRDDELVAALQLTTRALVTLAVESVTAVATVGLNHMRLLLAVGDRPGSSGVELAAALGTSASTVTRQTDRLVQSGHLSRQQNPANRSMVMLELTDLGREAVDDVLAWRAQAFERLTQDFDANARADLAAALRRIHTALTADLALERAQG